MDESSDLLAALQARIYMKAAAFLAEPARGVAAGYHPPAPRYRGQPAEPDLHAQAGLATWLRTIARKDLVGWHWRVDEGAGENVAWLVIIQRRGRMETSSIASGHSIAPQPAD